MLARARVRALHAARQVANDPVEVGAESCAPVLVSSTERTIVPEAIEEHLLHPIVDLIGQRSAPPARIEIGVDHRPVAVNKLIPTR